MISIVKWVVFMLAIVSASAGAQIVEQNSSSSSETRSGANRGAGSQAQASVGLFFAKMAGVELQGAAALGLDVERSRQLAYEYTSQPGVRSIEMNIVGLGAMDIVNANCHNFKRKSYTYTHHPMFIESRRSRLEDIIEFEETMDQVEAPYNATYLALPIVRKNMGDTVTPVFRFICLTLETGVIEQAITKLRKSGRGYRTPDDAELSRAIAYGFDTWRSSPSAKMLLAAIPEDRSTCLVPTPTGIKKGLRTVTCGPFEYQMETRTFLFGGTTMLDQNFVGGRRIVFDDSRSVESSQSRSSTNGTRRGVKVMP